MQKVLKWNSSNEVTLNIQYCRLSWKLFWKPLPERLVGAGVLAAARAAAGAGAALPGGVAAAGETCLGQPQADKLGEEVLLLRVFPCLCLQNPWLWQLRELDKQGYACAKFSFSQCFSWFFDFPGYFFPLEGITIGKLRRVIKEAYFSEPFCCCVFRMEAVTASRGRRCQGAGWRQRS